MPRPFPQPHTNHDRPIVSLPAGGLPVVRRLPTGTDAVATFERLRRLNHVLWLDSSRARGDHVDRRFDTDPECPTKCLRPAKPPSSPDDIRFSRPTRFAG